MKISRAQLKWVIFLFSTGMCIASLFLPGLLLDAHVYNHNVIVGENDDRIVTGGNLLIWGWWGLLLFEFAWLANPAYILAIITYAMDKKSLAKVAATIALLLGFTSYHAKFWYYDEGGNGIPIIGLGIGFYIWMYSFFILLVGCFIPSTPDSPSPPDEGQQLVKP